MLKVISFEYVDESYIAWNYIYWAIYLMQKMYMPIFILLVLLSCRSWH